MSINIKYATMVVEGVPRIAFTREELLYSMNSLDRTKEPQDIIAAFLEYLEGRLLEHKE